MELQSIRRFIVKMAQRIVDNDNKIKDTITKSNFKNFSAITVWDTNMIISKELKNEMCSINKGIESKDECY